MTGATLNGTVNSNNNPTNVSFEWGTTAAAYGNTLITGALAAGSGNTAVTAALSGLTCGTTYHYRVKAENSGGITYGGNETWTTLACLPIPPPPNYTGMWWNPNESGWGSTITHHDPSNIAFVAVYTYNSTGQPVWYVISSCPVTNNGCTGTLYRVTGGTPPTLPWNGTNKVVSPVGTGTFNFTTADSGTFNFTIDGVPGSKNISRMVFATGPVSPPVDYSDLWWNANESGWGISLTHQYGIIFAAWFVYDEAGQPVWYVASSCAMANNGCTGTLYSVTGGSALTAVWDGTNKVVTPVGQLNIVFNNANEGTMTYFINGTSGTRAITRQWF